jgi:hypothetical protein
LSRAAQPHPKIEPGVLNPNKTVTPNWQAKAQLIKLASYLWLRSVLRRNQLCLQLLGRKNSVYQSKIWETQFSSRSGSAKAYTVSAITLHGFVERIFRIEKETCPNFFSYLTKTLRQLLRLPY